jgi:hypothetical protein
MTLEVELEAAHAAARALAAGDESVAAVMAAEPGLGTRVYVVAFDRDGDLSYLALDAALEPLRDRRLVREAVTMLGLAERAEEASTAITADELDAPFAEAERELRAAGRDAPATAAAAVRVALAALSEVAAGPRLATPLFLDRVGAAAAELSLRLEEYRYQAERLSQGAQAASPDVEAAWMALALATRAGDPSDFSQAMTATTGAVEALADDVLGRLRSYD